jgi:hypothetical protein
MRILFILSFLLISGSARAEEDKAVNFYLDAFSPVFGAWSMGFDVAIGDFTIGLTNYTSKSEGDGVTQSSTGPGGRLNYYTNGAIRSSFRLSLTVQSITTGLGFQGYGSITDDTPIALLAGYHWVGKVVNIAGGVGVKRFSSESSSVVRDPVTGANQVVTRPGEAGISPVLEILVGVAF